MEPALRRLPTIAAAMLTGFVIIVAFATIALATGGSSHIIGATNHGHWASGTTVHAFTDHPGGTKHASIDRTTTGVSVCAVTSTVTHVDCQQDGLSTSSWGSHHTGVHIINHNM